MRVLFLGDVVGQAGCDFVRRHIPSFRHEKQVDIVVANGENSAEGNGILPYSADFLLDSGVDILTTGNHGLRRREIYDVMEQPHSQVIRPLNYHEAAPGRGCFLYDGLRFRLLVVNLQGIVYMDPHENPFAAIDRLLAETKETCILIDFHAEATAEKLAMAYYLDGRVSAVLGTHTHVQTADEKILPGGTGYITDAGMCGGYHSVLGVRPELAIRRLRTGLPVRFENEPDDPALYGVLLDIDGKTGKTLYIERVQLH